MRTKKWVPYALIFPAVIFIVLLYGYPIGLTIWQSFHEVHLLNDKMNFVGFTHYQKIFTDPGFYQTLAITVKYTVVAVFLKMGLGFLFAIILHVKIYFKKAFRFLILIPWAIPQVAVSTLWRWILDGNYGYLNYYLMKLHLIDKPIAYLSSPTWAFFSAAFVDAWLGISLVSMMLLSGLEAIPQSLYEAARMDGATEIRLFKDVTIPGLKRVFLSVLALVTIWTFNSFNVIFVLTQGGPMRATETLILRIYQEAFQRFNLGISATLSVITFVILSIMTVIYMRGMKENE